MRTFLAMVALAALCQPAIPTARADAICSRGVVAIGPTSCEFAENVAAVYRASGLFPPVVLNNVYSPATNARYTMLCEPSGAGALCTGGNGAMVNVF